MDSFPVSSIPLHLQQEIIKKLKPRAALRLQKTSTWGLDSVDQCRHFRVLREVEENRKNFGSKWTGEDQLEIGWLVKIQQEEQIMKRSAIKVDPQVDPELLEKVLSTWEKIFEKSRYSMRFSTSRQSFMDEDIGLSIFV